MDKSANKKSQLSIPKDISFYIRPKKKSLKAAKLRQIFRRGDEVCWRAQLVPGTAAGRHCQADFVGDRQPCISDQPFVWQDRQSQEGSWTVRERRPLVLRAGVADKGIWPNIWSRCLAMLTAKEGSHSDVGLQRPQAEPQFSHPGRRRNQQHCRRHSRHVTAPKQQKDTAILPLRLLYSMYYIYNQLEQSRSECG